MQSTVTVGIPFHKSTDSLQLESAIKSILNQSRKPDVVHLIQDGEISQELEEVVNQFQGSIIERITFQENHGLAYVLNSSINKTDTKYYARMDADDIALPNRLLKQLDFLESNPDIDILGSWTIDINNHDNELSIRKVPTNDKHIKKFIWTCPLIHPTVVFRISSIKKTELYNSNLQRRQDYEFWFRCVKAGMKFANIPEPLLKYRYTEDWFKKNTPGVIWQQVKMGWKGNKLVNASFGAYIGTLFPIIKILLPAKIGLKLNNFFKRLDPRDKNF